MASKDTPFLVSARKYRPLRFEEVHGQDHVTRTLENAVRRGRVAHAYLLCGPRGVGKTTVARILARAFNCEKGVENAPCNKCESCRTIQQGRCVDVLEIDAASNTGVDNIRDLRENAQLPPAQVKSKVYIIDEVHRLSGPAFDALLKILEEPPRHVRFIFATTEVHKVPSTILSRCQRFTFHRVPSHTIVEHLKKILQDQKDVSVSEEIREEMLYAIARASEGAVRDALSLFDQVLSFCGDTVNMDDVRTVLGLVSFQTLSELVDALMSGKVADAIRRIHRIVEEGRDPGQLAEDIISYYRDLMVAHVTGGDCQDIVDLPPDDLAVVIRQSSGIAPEGALRAVEILWEATRRMSFDPDPLLVLEVAAAKVALLGRSVSIDDLIEQINKMQAAGPTISEPSTQVKKNSLSESPPIAAPLPPTPNPALFPASPIPLTDNSTSTPVKSIKVETQEPAVIPSVKQPVEEQSISSPATGIPINPEQQFQKILEVWPSVVSHMKKQAPAFGFTLPDVKPLRLEETNLVLGVPMDFGFHLENLMKAENRGLLAVHLSGILGERLTITAEFSAEAVPSAEHVESDGGALHEGIGMEADTRTALTRDPVVTKVLELFEGRIAAVRPAS